MSTLPAAPPRPGPIAATLPGSARALAAPAADPGPA